MPPRLMTWPINRWKSRSKWCCADTSKESAACRSVTLIDMRYVLICKAAEQSVYSAKAIEMKISEGVWCENVHDRRAPDGHIVIDLEAVERWMLGEHTGSRPPRGRHRLRESAAPGANF